MCFFIEFLSENILYEIKLEYVCVLNYGGAN